MGNRKDVKGEADIRLVLQNRYVELESSQNGDRKFAFCLGLFLVKLEICFYNHMIRHWWRCIINASRYLSLCSSTCITSDQCNGCFLYWLGLCIPKPVSVPGEVLRTTAFPYRNSFCLYVLPFFLQSKQRRRLLIQKKTQLMNFHVCKHLVEALILTLEWFQ